MPTIAQVYHVDVPLSLKGLQDGRVRHEVREPQVRAQLVRQRQRPAPHDHRGMQNAMLAGHSAGGCASASRSARPCTKHEATRWNAVPCTGAPACSSAAAWARLRARDEELNQPHAVRTAAASAGNDPTNPVLTFLKRHRRLRHGLHGLDLLLAAFENVPEPLLPDARRLRGEVGMSHLP
jgi:hypothetical protein